MTRSLERRDDDFALERLKTAYRGIAPSHRARRRSYLDARNRALVFGKRARFRLAFAGAFFLASAVGIAIALLAFGKHPPAVVEARSRETAPLTEAPRSFVSAVEGAVALRDPGGAERRIAAGTSLSSGASLETAAGSSTTLRVGRHLVALGAGTSLSFEELLDSDVRVELRRGRADFEIAPLSFDERFEVGAGGLVVEVVGTSFSVSYDGQCTAVAVAHGAVRARFGDDTVFVRGGQERRFCAPDERASAPPIAEAPPSSAAREDATAPVEGRETPSEAPNGGEEEALYGKALELRAANDVSGCATAMREYLARYSEGTFVDEALFTLVRLDYRVHDDRALLDDAPRFLARNPELNAKNAEARVLYAEALLDARGDARGAQGVLSPFESSLALLPPGYREQAAYLLAQAARATGQEERARKFAESYLAQFPGGKYAASAKRIAEKSGAP